MTELPWAVQVADRCATEAALAHASAVGLFEVIDRFRFADPAHPIPAPGLADLPDEVHRHALDALHAAATAHVAAHHDDHDVLARALDRAQAADLAARRGLRHLAQVGLGVAQHAADGDEVELLERAMVGVLDDDLADTAAEDDFPLVGRSPAELAVEVAGLVARMICEQPITVPGDGPLGFVVTTAGGADPVSVRVTAGGGVEVDGTVFASPVTLTEVAATVVDRATTTGPGVAGHLTLEWVRP